MNIPNDVIYNIFFYINDYETVMNFFILNKIFYNDYIRRYNKTYRHKFKVLFTDIFSFLSLLPNLKNNNEDLNMYNLLTTTGINSKFKTSISNDIFFVYHSYKNMIYAESVYRLGPNMAQDLTNVILIQGPNHLDMNSLVIFNKNKVKIILSVKSRILELNTPLNFLYLRGLFENINIIMQ
jgi:hypothetical protein